MLTAVDAIEVEVTGHAPPILRAAAPIKVEPSQKLALANKLAPVLTLGAVGADRVETILQRNRTAGLVQNGISRQSKAPKVIALGQADRADGSVKQLITRVGDDLIWSAAFRVVGASAYRIALNNVHLPADTRVWVYNASGDELGPLLIDDLIFDGTVWLPALNGENQFVELAVPVQSVSQMNHASFEIDEVMELFDLQALSRSSLASKSWQDCDIPVACVDDSTFPATEVVRRATALLYFIKNGASFLCSGGLVASTGVQDEFLLTANHCFSTQREASTLSAYFDYFDGNCSQSGVGQFGTLPQVHGARLRATGLQSDFTLVVLNDRVPGQRSYLGWSTAPLAINETLFRHSYPEGMTQRFTMASVLDNPTQQCPGLAPPDFIYSQDIAGSTTGGSSGSLLLNAAGQVVGQLLGACPLVTNYSPCRYDEFYNLDGAFQMTYPHVAQWLDPSAFFPDTTVVDFSASIVNPSVDELFSLSASVRNQGLEPTSETMVHWYLSDDPVVTADDLLLAETEVDPLQHDQSQGVSETLQLVSPGPGFLGACVVAVATEQVTDNQCTEGLAIVVGHSDLQVTELVATAPDVGSMQLSATVENVGDVASNAVQLDFFSSEDQQIEPSGTDLLLGGQSVPGLAPGEVATVTLTVEWQPASPQWLASCAEADGLEIVVDNNCSDLTLPPLIAMTAEMMGIWALGEVSADQPGAGASLQWIATDDGGGLLAGVIFDYEDGAPHWAVFTGALSGESELDFELNAYTGADFPPRFMSSDVIAVPGMAAQLKFISQSAGFLQRVDANDVVEVIPMRRLHAVAEPSSSYGCLVGAYAFSDLEPGVPGHGLVVEIVQIAGGDYLALSWYAFVDGDQVFIVGVAPIIDGEANTEAYWYRGADGDPSTIEAHEFGTMTFRSTGPDTAELIWTSTDAQFSSGTSDLSRVSFVQGCL